MEPSRLTVGECVLDWIDAKKNVASSTRYKYRSEVGPIIKILGSTRLQDLKPYQVRAAYTQLANEGSSVRAQRRLAMHLRSALKEAVRLELISRNPAEGIKVSTPRTEPSANAMSPQEVESFLEAARGDPAYPVFYLLLALGLRRGEALGLEWRSVDLDENRLRVEQSLGLSGKGSKAELRQVKTPRSRRTLYFGDDVAEILRDQSTSQVERGGLVFTTAIGTPIHPRNLYRSFKRIAHSVRLGSFTVHDLRHTHASLALQNGVPAEVVSARLGHASVGFTLDQYRHLYEPEHRKAALTLNELTASSS